MRSINHSARLHRVWPLWVVVTIALLQAGWVTRTLAQELTPTAAVSQATIKIVAFGDSLIAGYGLDAEDAFPAKMQAALRDQYPNLEIVNAGVSGDTTAAALSRYDWAIPNDADGAMVLLGGNDFLRGLSPKRMRKNLDTILTKLKAQKLDILLLGMKAPRNTGRNYYTAFDATFPDLAKKHDALLDSFFLEGVAMQRKLNQIDGIHPNRAGVEKIVARLTPKVNALITRILKSRTARTDG
ncbi:MAG: arylesterase [Pseudomonadota bacterium]